MKLTIPTAITLFRIFLIPCFVLAYYSPLIDAKTYAAIIFFVAGISDWVDGYLARILNQESAFGAFLDPVADKLMVAVSIIVIVQSYPTIWMAIPASIIISREITVSALREWMAEIGERATVKVSLLGKIKTVAQMASIFLIIIEKPMFGLPLLEIGFWLFFIAAALTLYSMILYLKLAWPIIKKNS